MFFSQANPNVTLKSTNNNKYLEGKFVTSFDIALLLNEDDIEYDCFEMQNDFIQYYLEVPINAMFTTYSYCQMPDDQLKSISYKKNVTEEEIGI